VNLVVVLLGILVFAILVVGFGWLIYKLRPETVRVTARCAKVLHLEVEMRSPDHGPSSTVTPRREDAGQTTP
jgi:hypothetical protein